MDSTSSTAASQSTRGWSYDVFLSFRGPDTRTTFVDNLYAWLELKGIRTFKDDERLEKGDCISPSLIRAIQESRFLIAIFSKDYASSKWCLEEVATMMECQKKFDKKIVVPIFYNVEPSDVRKQKGSFEESFKEHDKKFKDDRGKVKRWRKSLKNAGYLKGHHLKNDYNGYEAKCVQGVTADILTRLNQALPVLGKNFVGLEPKVDHIGTWLRLESDDARFIGICGMGGIGKTTTAMAVFNKFSSQFNGGACFLADIRKNQGNIIGLQKNLIQTILKERSPVEISNVEEGKEKIKKWFGDKKVLIVLDDVDDHLEQLEKLAGCGDWFGRGSRVIITTRNAGVLRSHGVDEKYIYEVETLGKQEAIQVFIWYAFKKKPETGCEELCESIVRYAMGLPLALEVLGSYLCGLEAIEWKNTMEKLKDVDSGHISKEKIVAVLKISFDGLDCENKKIFLHIACFFRNWREEYVKDVLESCDLRAVSGIRELNEKSLISVKNGKIEMHDLIQEMGWRIARLEKPRSRVILQPKDDDVLSGEEPKHIEGIFFSSTNEYRDDENISHHSFEASEHSKEWHENISRTLKAFNGTNKFKILIVGEWYYDGDVRDYNIPSSLTWIEFPFYSFFSLPNNFHPPELVGFHLRHSSLRICNITQKLDKLTSLDLSYSRSLLETPDFERMPNLKRLNLLGCVKLKEIHLSVGHLKKLVLLDLRSCRNLEKLPSFIQVSSLKFLYLQYCNTLKFFPKIQASIPEVVELDLSSVGIQKLPSSIQKLDGLTKLCLYNCEKLVSLSSDLCKLKNLEVIKLVKCHKLESLPEDLGNLSKLEKLHVWETRISRLPSSIEQMTSLERLCLGRAIQPFTTKYVNVVPSVLGLSSLKRLQRYSIWTPDKGLPQDIGCLNSLEYLDLGHNRFEHLPESFSQLPRLRYLDISGFELLETLPELPATIRKLCADLNLVFTSNIAELATKYLELYAVSFSGDIRDFLQRVKSETLIKFLRISGCFRRETPFTATYPTTEIWSYIKVLFQYQCDGSSSKISINLNPSWYSQNFVGFVVCCLLPYNALTSSRVGNKDFGVIAKLVHKDNAGNKVLQKKCVILNKGLRSGIGFVCFGYIPFSSLWPKSKTKKNVITPNDYSVFEASLDVDVPADWVCNLLYKDDDFIFQVKLEMQEWTAEESGEKQEKWQIASPGGSRIMWLENSDSAGVAPIMECKEELNQVVVPIFNVVVTLDLRKQTASLEKAFLKHEEYFKDDGAKARVMRWKKALTEAVNIDRGSQYLLGYRRKALTKAVNIGGHDLCGYKYIGYEFACIKGVVNDIFKQLRPAPSIPKDLVGLESRLKDISTWINVFSEDNVKLIGIWGMGGIGKTTLATVAFKEFASEFDGSYFISDTSKHGLEALKEKLLSNIVKERSIMHVDDADKGVKIMIEKRLKSKRVLIVLDDVDEGDELDNLVGCGEWFPFSSRVIIITTRDKHLFTQFGVGMECYEVKGLDEAKGLQLFSWHAFKKASPENGFEDLCRDFVSHASGLPLVLKVWGSFLFGRTDKGVWESTLEKIKNIPDDKLKVHSQLRISYDGLDENSKMVFLAIVCFFRHESRDYVEDVLSSRKLHPATNLSLLVDRCLLYESDGYIDMHDLIHEMGLNIANMSRSWRLDHLNDGTRPGRFSDSDSEKDESDCELSIIEESDDVESEESDGESSTEYNDSGPDRTKPWQLTEIVQPVQCRMVSMPECYNAKVVRILYTNFGVGILALSSNGVQKLWKWSHNEQNPSGKATANFAPRHWQPNSGLLMTNDVSGVNLEEVVPCIDLSKDDSYVVSAAGGRVSLLKIKTFEETTTFKLPSASTFLAFHPHNNKIIAIGTEDSTIYLYHVRVDEVRAELRGGHQKRITGLAFSTNLNMLVSSGADAQLCVWSIETWKKRISVPIQLPCGKVTTGDTQVKFHTDQVRLLVTHETQLAVYDVSTVERIRQWTSHGSLSAPISSATYSCNSKLVYASFIDGNIGVLDADTLTLRCRIAPSAYLSQVISNRNEGVYPVVIAAHPQEPNQFAVGLTDGSVKVIEPLESVGCWEVSPPIDIEIQNGRLVGQPLDPPPATMCTTKLGDELHCILILTVFLCGFFGYKHIRIILNAFYQGEDGMHCILMLPVFLCILLGVGFRFLHGFCEG